jgi:hypothetical protein
MYRLLLLAAGLACAALLGTTPASAQITFTLNNVSLGVLVNGAVVNAGTLTGTFESNSNTLTSSSTLLTYDLVAPATGAINGHAFPGFEYTPADSTAHFNVGANGLLTGFELDAPLNSTTANASDAVRLYFPTNLSSTGSTTLGNATSLPASYEAENSTGGNRLVESGSVVAAAAPEPSSWMLGFLATGLFVVLLRRARNTRA